ncbi:alpha/beta hydrolase domain-containing protein [Falsirhodobacter sp. 1013]|uniref:alpha/beta hydrolase domain-containing protein n=1 Tax=Falsirhodobacter sp. 1013 TaxID=3417566 RepID=UPI003EBE6B04
MSDIVRLTFTRDEPFAGGLSIGDTGAYRLREGRATIRIAPNRIGADGVYEVEHIATEDGLITTTTDVWMLEPEDAARANGVLLFEFVNRGNKRVLQFFNSASATNMPKDGGNGWLMRQGYTILIAAWQGDVLPGDGRVTIDVPGYSGPDHAMTAEVTAEFVNEGPVMTVLPLSGKTGTRSYPADLEAPARLTRRRYPHSAPEDVSGWSFARIEGAGGALGAGDVQGAEQAIVPSPRHIHLPQGFQPGWLYHLTYTATDPIALDIGFVAVAELVGHLKRERGWKAVGWGRSQSGRAIRDFLHRGFNRDHAGARVFDGMLPHISGGGKTTMNRFINLVIAASREFEDHANPSDRFPFAYAMSRDHITGAEDAILKRPETDPKVIHTHSAAEYWHRRGSLVHTDTQGNDLPIPDNVRVFMWSSSQHWSDPVPSLPPVGPCQNFQNVVHTSAFFRGTLTLMTDWLNGVEPPESRIPRRADGTLVGMDEWRFPAIPATMLPKGPNPLVHIDYGPGFDRGAAMEGCTQTDGEYAVLVPQSDEGGNDIAGLRAPMVMAPMGSYTGWNLRRRGHGHGMLHGFSGSYIPFPETAEEAALTGDPRPPVLALYPDADTYSAAIRAAAERLVADRFMVAEDVAFAVAMAAHWGRINHLHSL